MFPFSDHHELNDHILSFLSPQDVVNCQLISRDFLRAASSGPVWRDFFKLRFDTAPIGNIQAWPLCSGSSAHDSAPAHLHANSHLPCSDCSAGAVCQGYCHKQVWKSLYAQTHSNAFHPRSRRACSAWSLTLLFVAYLVVLGFFFAHILLPYYSHEPQVSTPEASPMFPFVELMPEFDPRLLPTSSTRASALSRLSQRLPWLSGLSAPLSSQYVTVTGRILKHQAVQLDPRGHQGHIDRHYVHLDLLYSYSYGGRNFTASQRVRGEERPVLYSWDSALSLLQHYGIGLPVPVTVKLCPTSFASSLQPCSSYLEEHIPSDALCGFWTVSILCALFVMWYGAEVASFVPRLSSAFSAVSLAALQRALHLPEPDLSSNDAAQSSSILSQLLNMAKHSIPRSVLGATWMYPLRCKVGVDISDRAHISFYLSLFLGALFLSTQLCLSLFHKPLEGLHENSVSAWILGSSLCVGLSLLWTMRNVVWSGVKVGVYLSQHPFGLTLPGDSEAPIFYPSSSLLEMLRERERQLVVETANRREEVRQQALRELREMGLDLWEEEAEEKKMNSQLEQDTRHAHHQHHLPAEAVSSSESTPVQELVVHLSSSSSSRSASSRFLPRLPWLYTKRLLQYSLPSDPIHATIFIRSASQDSEVVGNGVHINVNVDTTADVRRIVRTSKVPIVLHPVKNPAGEVESFIGRVPLTATLFPGVPNVVSLDIGVRFGSFVPDASVSLLGRCWRRMKWPFGVAEATTWRRVLQAPEDKTRVPSNPVQLQQLMYMS